MRLNDWGRIVHAEWFRSGQIRREIELDAFTVMPNHIHGIVRSVGADGVRPAAASDTHTGDDVGARRAPLQAFIAGFKSATTRRIRGTSSSRGLAVWQRNYYEHIVRDEDELNKIREYIATNPLRWPQDRENPAAERDREEDSPWL